MIITNELLAAYAEGNVSAEERKAVRLYLAENPEIMESVLFTMENANGSYTEGLESMLDDITPHKIIPLPMTAMAAQNTIDNLCVIRCEGIAIRHFGLNITDEELLSESEQEGWLQAEGTALHNIGRLSGTRGLSVSHRYHSTVEDIRATLSAGNIVIVAVNNLKLKNNTPAEQHKDNNDGSAPNHVVIIAAVTADTITIIDSATPQEQDDYPLSLFIGAWEDSANYLILISNNNDYIPHPINLDDVEVEDELLELREAIAENAHEVWAETRQIEGWTYGAVRDDDKKHHPDMRPYNLLPESEKEYDRLMAMNTIKLVKKLGWEFRKKK